MEKCLVVARLMFTHFRRFVPQGQTAWFERFCIFNQIHSPNLYNNGTFALDF